MPRPRTPLKPAEVAAIKAAEVEWLRWWSVEKILPKNIPAGREEMTKLKKATKDMARAIHVLTNHHGSREMSQLIVVMQEIQGFRRGQDHYHQMIDDLVEPLQLLGRALARIGGRGGRTEPGGLSWVCRAADAWTAAGLPQPTAKGRFFRALSEVETAREIPQVTEERAAAALAHWRDVRAYWVGQSDRTTHSE